MTLKQAAFLLILYLYSSCAVTKLQGNLHTHLDKKYNSFTPHHVGETCKLKTLFSCDK